MASEASYSRVVASETIVAASVASCSTIEASVGQLLYSDNLWGKILNRYSVATSDAIISSIGASKASSTLATSEASFSMVVTSELASLQGGL